jgi:phosphatidate cytidylyltransferase
MSNTIKRILSALVMLAMVLCSVFLGKNATLLLCLLVGVLCVDELLVNFGNKNRNHFLYYYVQIIFIVLFYLTNIAFDLMLSKLLFTIVSILLNLFLIFYLFRIPLADEFMKKSGDKYPGLLSLLVVLPLLSFGIYFHSSYWKELLGLLLIVTFSMDTGAWFFGKSFGKHKLWPLVSPKKTVEGFVGGMVTSSFLGTYAWFFFFKELKWECSVIFAICGALSQVGDLIQSKIKREYGIKDSSNLIPGHGGVYDRIDSLIFLSPFFVVVVKYLGQHLSL